MVRWSNVFTLALMLPFNLALAWPVMASAGPEAVKTKLEPFALTQVRLLDGPCKVAQEADRHYLLQLEPDRLLYSFRKSAGLPTPGEPAGGWEAPDHPLRGPFLGHYLSACALMYTSTGDEALKAKAAGIVGELAKCQQASGQGFVSSHPESELRRYLSTQLSGKEGAWRCPFYMFHKTMAGLLDQYQLCGNRQALDVAEKMAGYFMQFTDREYEAMFGQEHGGFVEVLHNLYAATGKKEYLELGGRLAALEKFLPPLAERRDCLANQHANSNIPIVIGAARRYELTGEKPYRTMAEYFWDVVTGTRAYATGGTSTAEVWREAGRLSDTLTTNTQESCTSYNMLKLTRKLLGWSGEARYADYYERLFFNGILGTQDPNTGLLIYYMPLASGHKKEFGALHDSLWCCCGTGAESFAKIGDSIYFHDRQSLYVSLTISSEVQWPEKGMRLEQRTSFPREDRTKLIIHAKKPVRFALNLRIPYWTAGEAGIWINGEKQPAKTAPCAWFRIERRWKEGDTVELRLPMSLHPHPMPDDPNLLAIMYGPLVLAVHANQEQVVAASPVRPDTWLKPDPKRALTFHTVGRSPKLEFSPLNQILGSETYGVYVRVYEPGSPQHRAYLKAQQAKKVLAKK